LQDEPNRNGGINGLLINNQGEQEALIMQSSLPYIFSLADLT